MKSKINDWAKEAIIKNKGEIVNLVKFGQLSKGINSYNNLIGTYSPYTQAYADFENINIPKSFGAPYNFQWTGETFDNMKIKTVNKSKQTYNIGTIIGKQKLLEGIYGEIFDLTEENNNYVNEKIIEPYILKKIEEGFIFN